MGPRLFRRGNDVHGVGVDVRVEPASMGPRLFRRGNPRTTGCRVSSSRSFNGATPFQTWKYSSRSTRPLRRSRPASMGPRLFRRGNGLECKSLKRANKGFNGATPFQTWKFYCWCRPLSTPIKLQWGHAFSDVEMIASMKDRSAFLSASMGPRLFRRGN